MAINISGGSSSADIWVPAKDFTLTSGLPTNAVVGGGRYNALAYDFLTTETAQATVELPGPFSTISVRLYWTNGGAGSGNVVWSMSLDRAGDAETLAASAGGGSSGNTAIAAPAQDVLKVSALFTSTAADPSKLLNLRLSRIGGDAADTLGNDAAVLGVLVSAG